MVDAIAIVLLVRLVACPVVGFFLALFLRSRAKRINSSSACAVQNMHGSIESNREEAETHHHAELEIVVAAAGARRYSYDELAAATGDFTEEEKLGQGGFGCVYRGRLPVVAGGNGGGDGQQVAIKFLSDSSSQGRKEFEAEVKIITRLRHRNLVQLLGWCDCPRGLMLVYELVPGGSLDKHIYHTERLLTWPERYKIILGLASVLRYLHEEWEQCIVHGDIKPSNIMLDSSYNVKMGDFGLARLIDHGERWKTTKAVQGTAGYIDPEFVNTQRPSTESDVYSFGVVLLELVSGRKPVDHPVDAPPFMLVKWVQGLYSQNAILDAADGRLRCDGGGVDELAERQMERALVVGLWCAHPEMGERPSITQAMRVLQSDDARLPALSPQMYMAPPGLMSFAVGDQFGVSGSSSSSSGARSLATTSTTTRSSGLFAS
ncbi:probable kinase CHARK [Oryza brachyantha]|uniref:Protein kinase domain-containing protein n=1 Tax=Oryza brachyantha TaxID=4533 RepID=J3MWN4_ORYBR|nr:probable kinase CHARK [Oryza brachyantha]